MIPIFLMVLAALPFDFRDNENAFRLSEKELFKVVDVRVVEECRKLMAAHDASRCHVGFSNDPSLYVLRRGGILVGQPGALLAEDPPVVAGLVMEGKTRLGIVWNGTSFEVRDVVPRGTPTPP